MFDLTGMENFEVDGGGGDFLFHGYLCPFWIENAKNITLRNFSVDYSRTFHSEGEVVAYDPDTKMVEVRIKDDCPYKIEDKRLMFYNSDYSIKYPWWIIVTFDAAKNEPARSAFCNDLYSYNKKDLDVEEVRPGVVRFEYGGAPPEPGLVFVFNAVHRSVCAIVASTFFLRTIPQ